MATFTTYHDVIDNAIIDLTALLDETSVPSTLRDNTDYGRARNLLHRLQLEQRRLDTGDDTL